MRTVTTSSIAVLFFLLLNVHLKAQDRLESSGIYLVPITQNDTGFAVGEPGLMTTRSGFNDQPSFSFESQYMYYSSERDDYKTDICAIYIPQYQRVEFISTSSESEFVPQQKPDMTGLAYVREASGKRQIWFTGTDANTKNLTPDISDVGNFIWVNDSLVAVRLEKMSSSLCLLNIKTNRLDTLVKNVGTSIGKVPSEPALYYTVKENNGERLCRYRYDSGTSDSLLFLPSTCKDFSVALDGSVWTAGNGLVYRWKRASDEWNTVADFRNGELAGARRVALSRDMKWMAVVTKAGTKD